MTTNIKLRMKSLYKSFIRSFYYPKWWYQRARRGFSDRDMWNADNYLAGVFAGVLQWYIDKGMGVPTVYALDNDPYCQDMEGMTVRRNIEYSKYIAVFKEYAEDGLAYNEKWQKEFGGVLDKDMQEALQWLSGHFTELWD